MKCKMIERWVKNEPKMPTVNDPIDSFPQAEYDSETIETFPQVVWVENIP